MIRAVMEGAAYAHRDSFEILDEMKVPIAYVRASGGGARSPLWRQIMADVTGREHVTINVDEGPAYGVALLAGVGTGIYSDVPSACRAAITIQERTEPDPGRHAMYTEFYKQVYRPLYSALKELYATNAAIVEKYL